LSQELREQVRAGLSAATLSLLEEIEAFARLQINFAQYTFPLRATSFNPKAPATEVSPDGATIYLHDFDTIDQHGVTHELLHIQRYWIDRVPQIQPARNAKANLPGVQNIENTLEHLVIVPREMSYGFDSAGYWNAVSKHRWEQYPWPNLSARRNDILLERLVLELVSDQDVRQLAADCIRREGLTGEADRFAVRIKQLLGAKARAAACVVRFMKISKGLLHLTHIDVRNRSFRNEPIPEN
jgi:hypothetical protein